MTWSYGYVTNIPYTRNFYNYLNPQNIELCLLYNNLKSPAKTSFTYCELACGYGLTALGVASTHPNASVFAMDFNPEHIVYARSLAEKIGLSNIHFSDDSFADYLNNNQLPDFDYISLHGIYSWISIENRHHILNIIKNKLKPGGVVSVSYNCLPGWAEFLPTQYLINYLHQNQGISDPLKSLNNCWTFLEKFIEIGKPHILTNPHSENQLKNIKKHNPHYAVHELFNKDWHPLFVTQVIEEMAETKSSLVGAGSILDNIPAFCLHPDIYRFISELNGDSLKQLIKDFHLNTSFRRDLYQKGCYPYTDSEKKNRIFGAQIFPVVSIDDIKYEHNYQRIAIKLDKIPLYAEFATAVHNGINKVDDLWDKLNKPNLNLFYDVLFIFVGLGYFYLIFPDDPINVCPEKTVQNVRNFNDVIQQEFINGIFVNAFLSPVSCHTANCTWLENLFLFHQKYKINTPIAEYILSKLQEHSLSLIDDNGNKLESDTEKVALIEAKYNSFLTDRVPVLKNLKIL